MLKSLKNAWKKKEIKENEKKEIKENENKENKENEKEINKKLNYILIIIQLLLFY